MIPSKWNHWRASSSIKRLLLWAWIDLSPVIRSEKKRKWTRCSGRGSRRWVKLLVVFSFSVTALHGFEGLRELFKAPFFSPKWQKVKMPLTLTAPLWERRGLLLCTVAPQGRVCRHWVRRITGSNGQRSTLTKSPDVQADWSPSTDRHLPFSIFTGAPDASRVEFHGRLLIPVD